MLFRKLKKIFRWILFLLIVFLISFIVTTGASDSFAPDKILGHITNTANIISDLGNKAETSAQSLTADLKQDDMAEIEPTDDGTDLDSDSGIDADEGEAAAKTNDTPPSTLGRVERMVFIKKAVQAKINSRNYVKLQEIPESLQQAVVAVEDRKFYNHWGFDMEGIFRASLVNLQYGEVREGASTITQQLVKNLFLTHDQTFGRKGEELLLSLDMELNYSKDEILELYLNTIYFGSGYYGIKEACEGYFGKEPAMLALPEAAMLAGIPNAPSLYSPYVDFMLAKKRQFVVLDSMVAAGYLRENIAEDAKIKPIYLAH